MDLLSAFKRKTPAAMPAPAADEVQRARTRARQRLIGAAVLVVAGIIGFPLLFETQPRPIPVDLPIVIPRKESMPPLAMPSPTAPAPAHAPATTPVPQPASAARAVAPVERVIVETEEDAGREVATSSAALPASSSTPAKAASASPAARAGSATATAPEDGARARALLEGKTPARAASEPAAAAPRFVVQVGAFVEPNAVREARFKVEKLGLQTYTQVAETPSGPRTRVRVGPFATRDDAERAAARIKAAALPAAILAL